MLQNNDGRKPDVSLVLCIHEINNAETTAVLGLLFK